MPWVEKLFIRESAHVSAREMESIHFISNVGVAGDIHADGSARQVCLRIAEALPIKDVAGLCVMKFQENIRIVGLPVSKLKKGATLKIGECLLCLTSVGKKCYAECEIRRKKEYCSLSSQVAFAEVKQGGEMFVGDEVNLEDKDAV